MSILQCILANMLPVPCKPFGKTTDRHTETQSHNHSNTELQKC